MKRRKRENHSKRENFEKWFEDFNKSEGWDYTHTYMHIIPFLLVKYSPI